MPRVNLVLFLALIWPHVSFGAESSDFPVVQGRRPVVAEPFLRTGDAVALCLRRERQWQDFCNGLVQGYADYVVIRKKACVPATVTPQELVAVFAGPHVVVSTGYIDDLPAFETAVVLFISHFPCD